MIQFENMDESDENPDVKCETFDFHEELKSETFDVVKFKKRTYCQEG